MGHCCLWFMLVVGGARYQSSDIVLNQLHAQGIGSGIFDISYVGGNKLLRYRFRDDKLRQRLFHPVDTVRTLTLQFQGYSLDHFHRFRTTRQRGMLA